MNNFEWLAVGIGPLVAVVATAAYMLRKVIHRRRSLSNRIGQLGHLLEKRLSEPCDEPAKESKRIISEQILHDLRESEKSFQQVDSSALSSIHFVKDSVAVLADRLGSLEAKLGDPNEIESLNFLSLAVIYVRSHLSESIRVEDMANHFGVSSRTLHNYLRNGLDCSAQELINVIKMQEAKRLLKQGDLFVKEVAYRLGFENPYYFSARFKLFFGLSPKKLMLHYKKRNEEMPGNSSKQLPLLAEQTQPVRKQEKNGRVQPVRRAETQETQTLTPGAEVDRFIIVSLIGRGGMGEVYKAYDPKLNRGVALKLIRADQANSQKSQTRLLREAQALARLSHPNVLHVYDVGTFGNQVFITMALVEGETLDVWLANKKRSIKEILKVMIAAGRGLSAAHKAGLVHRDFKPSNVIVAHDGQVKVLDFGLARAVVGQTLDGDTFEQSAEDMHALDSNKTTSSSGLNLLLSPLTVAGKILGTPLYMSPEQYLGVETDGRTDIFSFCVVLYEALYGKRPFSARSMDELKSEVIREKMYIPGADTEVPDWLWQVIRKGMSARPEDRYQKLESLLQDLERDPDAVRRQKQQASRRRLFLISIILLTTALPIGVWYGLRYRTFQLCRNAEGEFVGVWDEETNAKVQQAFLGTAKSYAQDTWVRVKRILDNYKLEWIQMRSDICEAKLIRGIQSEEFFDLRMRCLHKRLEELGALVGIFTKTDGLVVQNAVQASTSLTRISMCADEEALRANYPPPKTAEAKAKVAAIHEKLVEVKAFIDTGKYQDGLKLVRMIEQKANALDYKPVQAEVLFWIGELLERSGDYKEAETTLHEAACIAGESSDAPLMTKAIVNLVWLVGFRQARHKEGLAIAKVATATLGLTRGNKSLQSDLYNYLGAVFQEQGKYQKALESYRKSLAITEKLPTLEHYGVTTTLNNIGIIYNRMGDYNKALEYHRKVLAIRKDFLGPSHPDVAATLNNMGVAFWKIKNYEKAIEYYRMALEINTQTLGVKHPEVAANLNNIGLVLWKKKKYAEATEFLKKALEIWQDILGKNHPVTAWPLSGLGEICFETQRLTEAFEKFTLATEVCEKSTCSPEPEGIALFGLAKVLWSQRKDRKQTLVFAQKASEIFAKDPTLRREVESIDAWIEKIR